MFHPGDLNPPTIAILSTPLLPMPFGKHKPYISDWRQEGITVSRYAVPVQSSQRDRQQAKIIAWPADLTLTLASANRGQFVNAESGEGPVPL
ncbi:hypothetical protein PoB_000188400 [Plakobranchus ocellatus]|uniref:Uncharacterized protein n=1 Tax=Plakobranchus ocellatus TaxID=259542 RepID=A0AAV3XZK9_9GAST|nr:hypothetical protein PoB_000188400 [Plakobranchus ocellatus]